MSETPAREDLSRYGWLAVATAVATISLKTGAWWVTGSVGLLADAAESVVNLVAAIVALIVLKVAAKPADHNHHFGHSKAEYFSAGVEGVMIFIAATSIVVVAVQRLINLEPLEEVGIGLAISIVASLFNAATAVILMRAGKRHNSITLTADGKHLMTDVYTSAGVVLAIGLVALTGWDWLDPVIAIAVGVNILVAGYSLMKESTAGLMDIALPESDNQALRAMLESCRADGVDYHQMRTRESGHRQFMEFHLLVPQTWTIKQGHDYLEDLVDEIRERYPRIVITGHLEPLGDPRSYLHEQL